jgi:hypothetical protein
MGLHLGWIGTRIAIFDQDIAAGRPSEFPEPLPEILKITLRVRIILGDPQKYRDPPHSDHRHRPALLRARRKRPCRRAAEQRDELAPSRFRDHSTTSPARASSVAGISSPSALAAFRLIAKSIFAGCCTGRSAGFSPLRMRLTYPAARRNESTMSGP